MSYVLVWRSYGFQDELCWGAAWLYKATGETTYQHKALKALEVAGVDSNEFSWDDKAIGCVVREFGGGGIPMRRPSDSVS